MLSFSDVYVFYKRFFNIWGNGLHYWLFWFIIFKFFSCRVIGKTQFYIFHLYH
eukprot:UN09007